MAPHPLARIVSRFKREPSRTGSLIITFHGDAILPRGGSVWLGTLLQFLDLLQIEGGVVRTAASRLAADGWLARDKAGRKSFYRLAPAGRARFEAAIAHVYAPQPLPASDRFELILIGNGAEREAARDALDEAGFGSPLPGVWVAPAGTPVPAPASAGIRLDALLQRDAGQRLVAASWDLARTAEAYRAFLKLFGARGRNPRPRAPDPSLSPRRAARSFAAAGPSAAGLAGAGSAGVLRADLPCPVAGVRALARCPW